ncbi:DHH family phosphoesterase [Geotalea sp. SG265]|uniref:DHH family phosphoesterase n=1 Tax=Geotalea sp. SG265 TaxID=2922867 RepID=UPI001FAF925A|nr:DHH family phosphoesterase [Geotalea sp. SG265]
MSIPATFPSLKEYVDEMLRWATGKGKILIVVHDNPDPDCFASALALNHLFVMKLNREAVLSFSGMIGRSENLAMAKELQIPLTPLAILDIRDFQVICMVDTQPGVGNNSLPPEISVDILIDHHPIRETSNTCRFVDIRPDYGVTATILYEYLMAENVPIGTKLATALFYAIKSETQDLGREANRPDREAYHRLFPLTNKLLLYEICHPKLPVEYFLSLNNALKHTRIYGEVLVTNLRSVVFPEIVAELADFLLRLEKIKTVLCIGHYNKEMILSMRTIRHDTNVGEIIKKLVEGMGTAGGHGMMAGGKVDNVSDSPEEMLKLERILTDRLFEALAIHREKPEKLIHLRPMKELPNRP